MATITAAERQRLGTVRPELWALLLELNDRANSDLGFRLAIPEDGGFRSIATQTALYNDSLTQGGGTLAYPVGTPGHSRHNYGAAFDEHIVAGGSADDGTGTDDDYHKLADLAQSLGLVAGYYFDARGVAQRDPYHFQLNETLQESIDRWNAMKKAGLFTAGAAAVAVLLVAALVGKS